MKNYIDMIPGNCDDSKEDAIIKVVMIDDMLSKQTYFAEMDLKEDGSVECYLKDSVIDILEALYRSEYPIVIWNQSLGINALLFKFDEKIQKVTMMFPMTVKGFKQSFLKNVLSIKGGDSMAKICPRTDDYVLYLDCKECEHRDECRRDK